MTMKNEIILMTKLINMVVKMMILNMIMMAIP